MTAALGWLIGSTPGRILIASGIFILWLWRHDAALETRVRNECRAEQIQKTLDETLRQRDAAQRAVDDAEKAQAVTDAKLAAIEKERAEINESVPKDVRSRECRVPRAVTDRLRSIR